MRPDRLYIIRELSFNMHGVMEIGLENVKNTSVLSDHENKFNSSPCVLKIIAPIQPIFGATSTALPIKGPLSHSNHAYYTFTQHIKYTYIWHHKREFSHYEYCLSLTSVDSSPLVHHPILCESTWFCTHVKFHTTHTNSLSVNHSSGVPRPRSLGTYISHSWTTFSVLWLVARCIAHACAWCSDIINPYYNHLL